jgi:hypothetical protein
MDCFRDLLLDEISMQSKTCGILVKKNKKVRYLKKVRFRSVVVEIFFFENFLDGSKCLKYFFFDKIEFYS